MDFSLLPCVVVISSLCHSFFVSFLVILRVFLSFLMLFFLACHSSFCSLIVSLSFFVLFFVSFLVILSPRLGHSSCYSSCLGNSFVLSSSFFCHSHVILSSCLGRFCVILSFFPSFPNERCHFISPCDNIPLVRFYVNFIG